MTHFTFHWKNPKFFWMFKVKSSSKIIKLEVSVSIDSIVGSIGEETRGTLWAAMFKWGSKSRMSSNSWDNNRWVSLPLANQVSISQSRVSIAIETRGTLWAAMFKGGGKTRVDSDSWDNNRWVSFPLAKVVSVDSVVGSIGEETRGTLWAAMFKGGGKTRVDSNSWDKDRCIGLSNSKGSKGNKCGLEKIVWFLNRTETWLVVEGKAVKSIHTLLASSVTSKKSPNVYKSCPKQNLQEKWKFWLLLKNCLQMWAILGKIIVTKGFEKLSKLQ